MFGYPGCDYGEGALECGFPYPYLGRQSFTVSSGLASIHDFPLTQAVTQPYTTQAVVQSLIGGPQTLGEATDDTSAGTFSAPVLNQLISVCQLEVDSYLSPTYRPPYARRFTVGTFRVLTVDSNGAILTIENQMRGDQHNPDRHCGYYLVKPATVNSVIGGYQGRWGPPSASGAVLTVTFNASAPFSVQTASVTAGGSHYQVGDIVGLVGGGSYLPAKVQMACTAFVCEALYKRRLAPGEENPFKADAESWRGTPTHPGLLIRIGQGEIDLDVDWPRAFSPGFAVVERNRLEVTSL